MKQRIFYSLTFSFDQENEFLWPNLTFTMEICRSRDFLVHHIFSLWCYMTCWFGIPTYFYKMQNWSCSDSLVHMIFLNPKFPFGAHCCLLITQRYYQVPHFYTQLVHSAYCYPGWGRARNRLWSDRPRPKWPLIRRECARRSLCARSALEAASDQASSRPKWPLIRQVPDHCPDEFQTIFQTKVRSKQSDQRMILNMNKSLNIVIIYSFHLSFYQSYIQLTKITNPESIVNESKSKKKDQKNHWVCHFFMLLTEKMNLDSSA